MEDFDLIYLLGCILLALLPFIFIGSGIYLVYLGLVASKAIWTIFATIGALISFYLGFRIIVKLVECLR